MQDDQQELIKFPELGVLGQTLSGMGVAVEIGYAQAGAVAERTAAVLRVGGAGGPVISESSHGVDFKRIWDGTDDDVRVVASVSTPALLVAYATASRSNAPWALDIASEFAVLMLSRQPPEGTVLQIVVPKVLTGRMPHVVSSENAARAFFLAGKMTLSPFRRVASAWEFGVEQEEWARAAASALAPRLGGASGFCGCCTANDAAAYFSNYSERGRDD
jgi:hypothetical protein